MLFNSFEFFAFYSTFLAVFFVAPKRIRPILILIASYVFYAGWRPSFLLLLILTTCVDYCTALVIDNAKRHWVRRTALITALTINLGILGTVKYLDFILTNLIGVSGFLGIELPPMAVNFVLPVGVSFYTFQSVGYTLDVYKRRFPAERNPLYYAIYVSFFPQLVAGPIERASHMLAQYKEQKPSSPHRITSGLWLVGWGLFKKMCIADLAAPFVKGVYANPSAFDGSYTLIATLLFTLQIYCDFSGYSDIAIGVARIMGFDLMVNFRQPYLATSLTTFWRRWHISLSTWFRDYLYLPLGGNRTSTLVWTRNILIVFAVSGIWHGANWTFLVWGLLHGTALITEELVSRRRTNRNNVLLSNSQLVAEYALPAKKPVRFILGLTYTLSFTIVGWVFFRANKISDALKILGSWTHLSLPNYGTFKILGLPSVELFMLAIHVIVLIIVDCLLAYSPQKLSASRRSSFISVGAAVVLFYDIFLFGAFGRTDFVYFQF